MSDRARGNAEAARSAQGVSAFSDEFAATYGRAVRAGPLKGLEYPSGSLSFVDALPAKLLGVYELEFQLALAKAMNEVDCRCFIDLGCAEGYFAVGFARAMPLLSVLAFDSAPGARARCAQLAEVNGVADRVKIGPHASQKTVARLPLRDAVVMMDVEGAERRLIDDNTAPHFRSSIIAVELHEQFSPGVGEHIRRTLQATHTLEHVVAGLPRDARLHPEISHLKPQEQEMALREGRDKAEYLLLRPAGS